MRYNYNHTIWITGYIVTRVKLAGVSAPIIKQLKWFEGRQEYILDVVLDPIGEWLVCACLSGDLYLLPILSLMTVRSIHLCMSDSMERLIMLFVSTLELFAKKQI